MIKSSETLRLSLLILNDTKSNYRLDLRYGIIKTIPNSMADIMKYSNYYEFGDNTVYVLGGYSNTSFSKVKEFYKFDLITNTFTKLASMY